MVINKNIIILLFLSIIVFGQNKNKLDDKSSELKVIQQQIQNLEGELSELSKKEKNNVSILKKLDQQNLLLNKSIKKIEKEEKQNEQNILNLNSQISIHKSRIKSLQSEYSKYLVWVYKQGNNSVLKYVFNAESFNQMLIRYKYLNYIHNASEKNIAELIENQQKLNESKNQIEVELNEKIKLKNQKSNEKDLLNKKRNEKKVVLASLKKDKNNVNTEIDQKRKIEITIKKMIADLIEKEREKERQLRTAKLKGEIKDYNYDFNYSSFENFTQLKGVLSWPISAPKVGRSFGENKNDKTKTVTLNYGIDIIAKVDQDVFAVAEGIVSAIEWIPGYGSVLILTHRDNYRTVYGHLSDISVLEGNKVKAGDLIGKVNESLEGNILHFEIWNERNYQNPQEWLVKK
ncbi:MAG: peptidoglycan DD-metalloendopeptidase family protein [Ignavibacteriae bacterium]|nr:peptidoglycan DD-metalloendopeptidase family protein [Ignavibacteriota bacterium]